MYSRQLFRAFQTSAASRKMCTCAGKHSSHSHFHTLPENARAQTGRIGYQGMLKDYEPTNGPLVHKTEIPKSNNVSYMGALLATFLGGSFMYAIKQKEEKMAQGLQ
eukprot:UN01602